MKLYTRTKAIGAALLLAAFFLTARSAPATCGRALAAYCGWGSGPALDPSSISSLFAKLKASGFDENHFRFEGQSCREMGFFTVAYRRSSFGRLWFGVNRRSAIVTEAYLDKDLRNRGVGTLLYLGAALVAYDAQKTLLERNLQSNGSARSLWDSFLERGFARYSGFPFPSPAIRETTMNGHLLDPLRTFILEHGEKTLRGCIRDPTSR